MTDTSDHRTRPPEPGPIRSFDFPPVESARLDGGLDLRLARMPRLPVLSLGLIFPAGEAVLDDSDAGLAVVTGDSLEGGTEDRTGIELAEALEGIGARMNVVTGWDATHVSLSCLADRAPEAMELLAEVVRRPAFPEGEVERTRAQRLARIRQRAMDPSSLASDRAAGLIYADGVPYGRPAGGTEESVEELDRRRIGAFHRARYRPQGGGFVITGDVDFPEMRTLVEGHFGDWDGSAPERPDFDAEPRSREREVHVIHREGAVQSEIRVGHPGASKKTPDYFPLLVGNSVLGGTFSSRLNLNLRERHGYTYGVRSRFAFRRNEGPFSVSTSVGTEVTAAAVREIMNELEAMVDEGPTEEETAAARDYMAGVFPLRMETSTQVASRIAELLIYDLPADWHARYRERIREVEAGAAAAALRRHIRPGEAQIVVVGDADAVGGPLEELELGPVTVHRE